MIFTLVALALESPKIVKREPMPYVAIRETVTMEGMATVFPRLMPRLQKWIQAHKVKANGPEFIRLIYVDMQKGLDIELGLPIAGKVKGDKQVQYGVMPGGRYVSLTHFGDYAGLVAPNAELQKWGNKQGVKWNVKKTKRGEEFVSRFEFYKTDPMTQPDKSKWETEILYMIR